MTALPPVFRAVNPGASSAAPHLPSASLRTKALVVPVHRKYEPAAEQLPGAAQDTDLMTALPPVFRAVNPGASSAAPHLPSASLRPKALVVPVHRKYEPAAEQLPGAAQDTDLMTALPPVFRAVNPGASSAAPHLPSASLRPKALVVPVHRKYEPAAEQLPGAAQDTELMSALPPVLRAVSPGASSAAPHLPSASLRTKALVVPPRCSYEPAAEQLPGAAQDSEL